jgi:hypothetical protein
MKCGVIKLRSQSMKCGLGNQVTLAVDEKSVGKLAMRHSFLSTNAPTSLPCAYVHNFYSFIHHFFTIFNAIIASVILQQHFSHTDKNCHPEVRLNLQH